MSSVKTQSLLDEISHFLFKPTLRYRALSSKEQLCIALHWFGNGGQYHAVGEMHGVSSASVCRVVLRAAEAINEVKFPDVVDWPEDVYSVVTKFDNFARMPYVVGCVDGTLINIDAPSEHEMAYLIDMGSTEWGVSNTPYTPRPDLVAVEKLVNMKRMLQKRQMPLSLVVTDPARRQEVDDFYLAAQLHRDQYKDHTGKLHPLVYFKNPELRWKCAPDFMKIYMKCPQYYVKYRDPLVLPKTLARTFPCPPLPERSLAGRRYKHSDYAYKR